MAEKLYKTYSRWHGGGQPDTHAMSLDQYQFATRLSNFFGMEL